MHRPRFPSVWIRVQKISADAYRISLLRENGESMLSNVAGAKNAAERARRYQREYGADDIVWDASGRR